MITPCEICGSTDFKTAYKGPVRDGKPGVFAAGEIKECGGCGVQRLEEQYRKDPEIYDTGEYRKLLSVELEEPGFMRVHDNNQHYILSRLWPHLHLRGRVVADVGAAMGSLLDQVKGFAGECVAIEPCRKFHEPLKDKGYKVIPYARDAEAYYGMCDYVFSIDVIEHTENPVMFLREIKELLAPGGKLIIVTPNREEVLMRLAYDTYAPHWYRTVHNWYFDHVSLEVCIWQAGLAIKEEFCLHRFGLANLIHWLKCGKPMGYLPVEVDTPLTNQAWKTEIEGQWAGDNLCFILGGKR